MVRVFSESVRLAKEGSARVERKDERSEGGK